MTHDQSSAVLIILGMVGVLVIIWFWGPPHIGWPHWPDQPPGI